MANATDARVTRDRSRRALASAALAGSLAVSPVLALPGHADEAPVRPEPGSAAELYDRGLRNLYAEDYIQTLVLATQSRGGNEMRRRLQITRRQSTRPGKALLRFLYPQTIRRTSILILENDTRADDFYVYLPAVKLTRHLSSAQRADSFFGTDLTYEDVEPKHIEDYVVEWASEENASPEQLAEAVSAECELLEVRGTVAFDSAYERQITCVERARAIALWTDYYRRGKFLKRLTIDLAEVRRVGDRYIPFLITVNTPRQRSVTKVITEEYELRAEIRDELFSTWNLEAGDAKADRRRTTPAPPAMDAARPGPGLSDSIR